MGLKGFPLYLTYGIPKVKEAIFHGFIRKDYGHKQTKLVIHIRPRNGRANGKGFSDTDWKDICNTIFLLFQLPKTKMVEEITAQ